MTYRTKSSLWIGFVLAGAALVGWAHDDLEFSRAVSLFTLCFACELIDSGLGMGYGTVMTPTLILLGYEPVDIVPTVLLSELLSGFTASFFHHDIRNVDFRRGGRDLKPAALLSAGSVVGVSIGVMVALNLPQIALRQVIGCIILLSGFFVVVLARRVVAYRGWKMLVLSVVASFNKAVSGGGYGPLVTSGQVLTGVPGKSAVGITSFAEAFTCLLASTLFLIEGGHVNLTLFIPMCAGALCSVPFSVFAINKANEDHLKIIIGVLTMAIGAATLRSALQQGQ